MGERHQEPATSEPLDDLLEPMLADLAADLAEEEFQNIAPVSSGKQRLVEKRRLAEQRLEERRLRDELGDYDLELNDC